MFETELYSLPGLNIKFVLLKKESCYVYKLQTAICNRLFNNWNMFYQRQTLDAFKSSSDSLESPSKLFLLSALDLGKYITIADIKEKEDSSNAIILSFNKCMS